MSKQTEAQQLQRKLQKCLQEVAMKDGVINFLKQKKGGKRKTRRKTRKKKDTKRKKRRRKRKTKKRKRTRRRNK